MNMSENLVTIAAFAIGQDPAWQAELAKMKLESAGIPCFLAGRNFVATYWLLSSAEGGIKLQVRRCDAERARQILSETVPAESGLPPQETGDEPACPQCPKCHCEDVEYERFSKKAFFLSILLLGFPVALLKRTYKCKRCGYTWK